MMKTRITQIELKKIRVEIILTEFAMEVMNDLKKRGDKKTKEKIVSDFADLIILEVV